VFTTGSFLTSINLGGGAQPCAGGFDLYLAKFGP